MSQLKVNEASIQSAEAAVRNAELNLEYTKITSPIDGRVSRTRVTEGNYVQPGSDDATVLTTVVTTDPIYVYFNVDEPTLLKYQQLAMRNGEPLHPSRLKDLKFPVEIGLENEKGFPHAGILDFADNHVDREHGHAAGPRRLPEHRRVPHPRPVRPRADPLRKAAQGAAGQRAGRWAPTSGSSIC